MAGDGGGFGAGTGLEVDESAAGAVNADDGFNGAESGEEGADVVFCEVVFDSIGLLVNDQIDTMLWVLYGGLPCEK